MTFILSFIHSSLPRISRTNVEQNSVFYHSVIKALQNIYVVGIYLELLCLLHKLTPLPLANVLHSTIFLVLNASWPAINTVIQTFLGYSLYGISLSILFSSYFCLYILSILFCFCFCIQSDNLCFLISAFGPFIINVISYMIEFKPITLCCCFFLNISLMCSVFLFPSFHESF